MSEAMVGIFARKIGMTQFFSQDGRHVPVTLFEAVPCPVIQVKTVEKDGYNAIQVGYGAKPERLMNKAMKGHLKKSGIKSVRKTGEMRVDSTEPYKVGQVIDISIFNEGDFVDVSGATVGRGFQGGVKRHHWVGGPDSHGSMQHRQVGSVGASSFPSRIMKGHRMPGRMGGVKRTVQNLEVIKIDKEKNLLAIKGAVPGNEDMYLFIRGSKKRTRAVEAEKAKRREAALAEAAKEVKKETRPEKKKDEKKETKAKS